MCHVLIALRTKALNTVVYLLLVVLLLVQIKAQQYEWLFQCIPSVDHFIIFGCLVYTLVTTNTRKKWDEKTMKCVLLGYDKTTKEDRFTIP